MSKKQAPANQAKMKVCASQQAADDVLVALMAHFDEINKMPFTNERSDNAAVFDRMTSDGFKLDLITGIFRRP